MNMKFEIELDDKLIIEYAKFLGFEEEKYLSKDFNKDEYILYRLTEDIKFVIDIALNPH